MNDLSLPPAKNLKLFIMYLLIFLLEIFVYFHFDSRNQITISRAGDIKASVSLQPHTFGKVGSTNSVNIPASR